MKPPIKKLAVLFLIAAVLTSSLALSVSALINRSTSKNAGLQQGNTPNAPADYKIYGAGPNGQNLTEEVTDIFARQLVEANPQGPLRDEDGSIMLLSPTSTELFSYLTSNTPSEDVLKQPIDESRIQIVQNYETSDVSHYLSEVLQIQSGITSNPIWQAGLSPATATTTAPIDLASETAKILEDAQKEMYAMKVPAPFVSLHKSLLAFFSTTASFSNMVLQDPVAAVALADNMDRIIVEQNAGIGQSIKDIEVNFPEFLSILPQEDRSALAEIFGISTAHASVVEDVVHWAISIAEWAKEFWIKYKDEIIANALGFLKNALMKKISAKVITWAQGAGVPGYVTNWALFEAQAAFDAKTGLISKESAKLCGNAATSGLYGNVLASALGVSTQQLGVTGVNQTWGETPGCPSISSGFYNTGGYDAENFLQSMTHNTYNNLLDLRDESVRAAAQASQASVNEALSGRGSLDVKKCDDGSTPGGTSSSTESEDPNFVGPVLPANLKCADGSAARTITPGSAKQELISKALSGAQDIIAGVNNEHMYSAVIQVLENAILEYALKEGEGIFENSSGSGGGTPPPPPPPGGNITALKNWYISQLNSALNNTNGAISIYTTALGALHAAQGTCSEEVALQIADLITGFEAAIATLTAEAANIQSMLSSAQAAQDQASLLAIGTAEEIRALAARASEGNDRAQTDLSTVGELMQSCQPTGP